MVIVVVIVELVELNDDDDDDDDDDPVVDEPHTDCVELVSEPGEQS